MQRVRKCWKAEKQESSRVLVSIRRALTTTFLEGVAALGDQRHNCREWWFVTPQASSEVLVSAIPVCSVYFYLFSSLPYNFKNAKVEWFIHDNFSKTVPFQLHLAPMVEGKHASSPPRARKDSKYCAVYLHHSSFHAAVLFPPCFLKLTTHRIFIIFKSASLGAAEQVSG